MPPRLTKPTEVPASRHPLANMLWQFYIVAGYPSTGQLAETIKEWPEAERKGSANRETIRRTLRAETVGSWHTVEMIFLALCELADVDPDDVEDDDGDRWNQPDPHRVMLQRHWHEAAHEAPMPNIPRTRTQRAEQEAAAQAQRAAFARSASAGLDEEPPF